MSIREELDPRGIRSVMELVAEAGLDVSEWASGRGGVRRAANNPRFCFEWAYFQTGRALVLNLWLESFEEQDGRVTCRFDALRRFERLASANGRAGALVVARARRAVECVQAAQAESAPVRVVVLTGERRGFELDLGTKSKVRTRSLDPVAWAITGRDPVSGDWILERGAKPVVSVDQFAVVPGDQSPAPVVTRTGRVRLRDAGMRVVVLGRAIGCCEWCGVPGFLREDGSRYLEVHHIVSLADDGADHPLNMIALCPNHHREAHHSVAREAMRAEMAARVRRLMGPGTDRGPHPDE